jgi:formylglycine-generating enzyme required for sulfatase activity
MLAWCQERFKSYPQSKAGTMEDNEDIYSININEGRVLRSGSFFLQAANVRSPSRYFYPPANRVSLLGFRPARTYR